ncbi:MAG TPA: hypothetical protein VE842_11270 [Pyrinomonadaceae bacterium]|jgi:hypothetical protein|nr:hypothetical protein [Pyrinomonadaceae bacterium]
MPNFTLTDGQKQEVDLGNSNTLTITTLNATAAQIYIDYKTNGNYSSAIKGSAGYSNPINLAGNTTKVVQKSDLESEHVRVGVTGENSSVKFTY